MNCTIYMSMSYLIRLVLAKPRLILDEMCRLYRKFVSYLRCVLCKTRLIFPRINGPSVPSFFFLCTLLPSLSQTSSLWPYEPETALPHNTLRFSLNKILFQAYPHILSSDFYTLSQPRLLTYLTFQSSVCIH